MSRNNKRNVSPNAPLPCGSELMGYRIVKLIARDSSSFVYLAENFEKQFVAVKEFMPHKMHLRGQMNASLTIPREHFRDFRRYSKTFLSECRVLSHIVHPRVVRLIDFFRTHNTFYMVTSYEPGSSLKDLIFRRVDKKNAYKSGSLLHALLKYYRHKNLKIGYQRIIGESWIKNIFSQIIDGLSVLHERDLLYLDLNPENIYLSRDGKVFLLDLGAARHIRQKNKTELNWVYTREFAAPELLQKKQTWMGPWTDAYSLGGTIFACMCGYAPQPADQRKIDDKMPKAFKALRRLYGSDLPDLIEWCLQLNREHRPQSMLDLQEKTALCRSKIQRHQESIIKNAV